MQPITGLHKKPNHPNMSATTNTVEEANPPVTYRRADWSYILEWIREKCVDIGTFRGERPLIRCHRGPIREVFMDENVVIFRLRWVAHRDLAVEGDLWTFDGLEGDITISLNQFAYISDDGRIRIDTVTQKIVIFPEGFMLDPDLVQELPLHLH